MANDNYFILLELQPTAGKTEIANKIATCEEQWKKDKDSRLSEIKEPARQNLKELDNIKSIMLHWDEDQNAHSEYLRQQEEAKEIFAAREDELNNYLAFHDQLTDSDIEDLLRQCEIYWLNENDVRRLFEQISSNATGTKGQRFHTEDYLDKNTAYAIESNLKKVMQTKKGATLYDFLGISRMSSAKALLQEAKKQYDQVKNDPQQTSTTAEKNLYNICVNLFANEDGKRRYDRYLELTKYPATNSFIDNSVKKAAGKDPLTPFTQADAEKVITTMWNMNEVPVQESLDFIKNYCGYNGYPLGEINEKELISKYGELQSQADLEGSINASRTSGRQTEAIEELKRALKIGISAATAIQNAQRDSDKLAEEIEENRLKASALKNDANELDEGFGGASKYGRRRLIVWIIVHALAWIGGLFVTEAINSTAGEVLWVFLMVIIMIVSAVFAIRALVSMVSCRREEKEAVKQAQTNLVDWDKVIESEERQKKNIDDRVVQLKNENRDALILTGQFRFDPKAYSKGYEMVNEGLARSIDDVNDLLQRTAYR